MKKLTIRIDDVVREAKTDDMIAQRAAKLETSDPRRAEAIRSLGRRLSQRAETWTLPVVAWTVKQVERAGEWELGSIAVELADLAYRHDSVKNSLPPAKRDLNSYATFAELKSEIDPLFQDRRATAAFQATVRSDLGREDVTDMHSLELMQYALDHSKVYLGPSKAEDIPNTDYIVVQPLNKMASQLWGRPQECGVVRSVFTNFAAWCTTQVVNPNAWSTYRGGSLIYALDVQGLLNGEPTRPNRDHGLACFINKDGRGNEWFALNDANLRDDVELKQMSEWERQETLRKLKDHPKYKGESAQEQPLYKYIEGPVRQRGEATQADIEEIKSTFGRLNQLDELQLQRFLMMVAQSPHNFVQEAKEAVVGSPQTIERLASIFERQRKTSLREADTARKIQTLMRTIAMVIAQQSGLPKGGLSMFWDLMVLSHKTSLLSVNEIYAVSVFLEYPGLFSVIELLPPHAARNLAVVLKPSLKAAVATIGEDPSALEEFWEETPRELWDKLFDALDAKASG